MEIKANDYNMNEIVKIIREWTELSQKDFAKLVGKSYGAIIKYENGQRQMSLPTFLEICKKSDINIVLTKKNKNR